jgi:hypothetical protein
MNKGRMFAAVLGIIILGATILCADAQTQPNETQKPLPPGVIIRIEATPKVGTIGDPIRINLDIAMPAGCQVEIPRLEKQISDFAILEFLPGIAVPEAEIPQAKTQPSAKESVKRLHQQARILTAVYKTGKFSFPPIPLKLKTADGKTTAIATSPVNIEIQSVLAGKDQNLKDLKKQAEIPEPFRWLFWLGMTLACIILAATSWFLWRRNRKRQVSLTPEQTRDLLALAEADLRDLLARGLPGSGMEKQFYVLLSEIVKRILEPGYEIHTAEQTTSEIMQSLTGRGTIETKKMELIESFLLRCDVVKFAKYIPSKSEQEAATNDALQILADAKNAAGARQSSPAGEKPATGSS